MLFTAISASHFCGKVIEDQTPVTTGCYVTHVCMYMCVYYNIYKIFMIILFFIVM